MLSPLGCVAQLSSDSDALEVQSVATSGHSVLAVDVTDGLWMKTALGLDGAVAPGLVATSAVIVPLIARGDTLGTLTLVSEHREHAFSAFDLAFIEELGRRLASGIDNAQLYSAAQHAIRMREDVLAIVSHDLRNPLDQHRHECGPVAPYPREDHPGAGQEECSDDSGRCRKDEQVD